MRYIYIAIFFILNLVVFIGLLVANEVYLQPTKRVEFLSSDVINYLRSIPRGVLSSSVLTLESKHKIVGIDKDPGIMAEYNIPYKYRFLVTIEDGKTADIYITDEEISSTSFSIKDGMGEKAGSLGSFNIGDNILLERSYGYSVEGRFDTRRIRTKITKIVN